MLMMLASPGPTLEGMPKLMLMMLASPGPTLEGMPS